MHPPLTDISPRAWEHPADARALAALRALPGFDLVVRKSVGRLNEWVTLQRIGPRSEPVTARTQPRLHALYAEACRVLDVHPAPPLYLQQMKTINAAAMGMDAPFIALSDQVLGRLRDDEILVILGHELGHILSGHVLYKTMLRVGLYLGWTALSFPVSAPLVLAVIAALAAWDRESELSADRASLLVVQDPEAVRRALEAVAAASPSLERPEAVSEEVWARAKVAGRAAMSVLSGHPNSARRVTELGAWVDSGEYARILAGDYPRRADLPPPPAWQQDLSARVATTEEGLRRSYRRLIRHLSGSD